MMSKILLKLFSVFLIVSCKNQKSAEEITTKDNTIGSKIEMTGMAFLKKSKGYFLISKGDTSDLTFVFTEDKYSEAVGMYFEESERSTISYRQKLEQLKQVLPQAEKEFRIANLRSLMMRTLASNGDIAIEVTEDFMKRDSSRLDYNYLEILMKDSKLAKDMNEMFAGYSVKVKGFSLEKLHFTSKEDLLQTSVIERDSTKIPDRIIDCIIWIEFEPTK